MPNIPSRMARTASFSLSNIFSTLLMKIGKYGEVQNAIINNHKIEMVYIINGNLINKGIESGIIYHINP